MSIALALGALAVFVAIVWYAYDQGRQAGSEAVAPLIKAPGKPVKIKPSDPGGMAVPNRDKVIFEGVSEGGEQRVERLLPAPETPLPPPAKPAADGATETAPAARASLIPPPPKAVEGSAAPKAAEVPAAPKAVAAPKNPVQAPTSATPRAESKPTQVAKAVAKPAAGTYRVQIAAVRSAKAARAEWARLQRKNKDVLGSLTFASQKVDLGAKGVFYRIQAGMVARAEARKICATLRARKQPCLVVKP
ncbi:MAG: SPOR domain-containing protein [Alphaproteobacteria bacterium]|nr:SPOR domain-containing protein [Alphaproteobacteria bacterium]